MNIKKRSLNYDVKEKTVKRLHMKNELQKPTKAQYELFFLMFWYSCFSPVHVLASYS